MIYSQLGLVADFIGAIMLFKYGLPSRINTKGTVFAAFESEEKKLKRNQENQEIQKNAEAGLILLISGFFLQLVGTFAK